MRHARAALPIACLALAATAPVSASERLACKIGINRNGPAMEILALVSAPRPIQGSYRLQVTMQAPYGGSTMNHGGTFMAGPGAPQVVGRFALSGGGRYTATLQVTADGHTIDCTERIDGTM
jgi:hypothetical protein